jgi:glucose-1-phosphate adenylyltransferase
VLPRLVDEGRKVYAYDFRTNRIPTAIKGEEQSYWRDVGTIEAYFEANMDLRAVNPTFNLYNRSWPIRTVSYGDPPAKFVFDEEGRRGVALDSIVAEGTIISGSTVRRSVIGRNVRIHSYCLIEDAVLMNLVEIGRGCRIRRAIIDKNVSIPPGTEIGYNADKDREHYVVTDTGIVVVPREEPRAL